jgi:hypothetical protein
MTHKKPRDGAMLEMIAARNGKIMEINEARHEKQQIEEEIVIRLLRDNDHRYFNVAWRKLEQDIIRKRK